MGLILLYNMIFKKRILCKYNFKFLYDFFYNDYGNHQKSTAKYLFKK